MIPQVDISELTKKDVKRRRFPVPDIKTTGGKIVALITSSTTYLHEPTGLIVYPKPSDVKVYGVVAVPRKSGQGTN